MEINTFLKSIEDILDEIPRVLPAQDCISDNLIDGATNSDIRDLKSVLESFNWIYELDKERPSINKIYVSNRKDEEGKATYQSFAYFSDTDIAAWGEFLQFPILKGSGFIFEFSEGYFRNQSQFHGHVIVHGDDLWNYSKPNNDNRIALAGIKQAAFFSGLKVSIDSSQNGAQRSGIILRPVSLSTSTAQNLVLVRARDGLVIDRTKNRSLVWWWRHGGQNQLFEKIPTADGGKEGKEAFMIGVREGDQLFYITLQQQFFCLKESPESAFQFIESTDHTLLSRDTEELVEVAIVAKSIAAKTDIYKYYSTDAEILNDVVLEKAPSNRRKWMEYYINGQNDINCCLGKLDDSNFSLLSHPYLPIQLIVMRDPMATPIYESLIYVRDLLRALYDSDKRPILNPGNRKIQWKNLPGLSIVLRIDAFQESILSAQVNDTAQDSNVESQKQLHSDLQHQNPPPSQSTSLACFQWQNLDIEELENCLLSNSSNINELVGYVMLEPWLNYLVICSRDGKEAGKLWCERYRSERKAQVYHPL